MATLEGRIARIEAYIRDKEREEDWVKGERDRLNARIDHISEEITSAQITLDTLIREHEGLCGVCGLILGGLEEHCESCGSVRIAGTRS